MRRSAQLFLRKAIGNNGKPRVVNIDKLHTLENDPDNYIRILNKIDPDDLKMMELFTFLKNNVPNKGEMN